jgi:predicted O-methyltransferase YrrM
MEYPNWFEGTGALQNFERHLLPLKDKPIKCLQIGAFTGDASKWLLDEVLTHPDSHLVDVDTWEGSKEEAHSDLDFDDVYEVYRRKVSKYRNVTFIRSTSDEFFRNNTDKFDFIYIDGDHRAFGVMKDLINSYYALNLNGIIACDDYQWSEGTGLFYEPRPAVDSFFNMTRGLFDVIEIGWQVWFKNTKLV